jgi:hypothetical protein
VLEAVAGELVLVRFSPMNLGKFIQQATDNADLCEAEGDERVYAISTFGGILGEDDDVEAFVTRVCEQAECGGERIWLITGGILRGGGYNAVLSEPPPAHHDIILGDEQSISDDDALTERAQQLVELFRPGRERNPAWKRN